MMLRRSLLACVFVCVSPAGFAQTLDTHFSCSETRLENGDGERIIHADQGKIKLDGNKIEALQWESNLFRTTHGFDCSIDEGDEPQAEVTDTGWRITLRDSLEARARRGYDTDHGLSCSMRLVVQGDVLQIKPSCPMLCGSRGNFTALTVDLKTGSCHYEE
jgi:hypothetical protein